MDFGKLTIEEVGRVNFRLPQDAPFNAVALSEKPSTQPHIFVGCPVWSNKTWQGKIYPYTAKSPDFLKLYSRQFNTIELNVTHYQIPTSDTIQRWYHDTPVGFTFCPKFPQIISHDKLLQNCAELTHQFCESIAGLKEKLGVSFLQVAPQFSPKHLPILEKYIQFIPQNIPLAIEFRHEDWFKDPIRWHDTLAMLHRYGVGTVITDVAGRRDVCHQSLSNATATIRWVGNEHSSDHKRVDEWTLRLKNWLDQGLQKLFLFVHVNDNNLAPELVHYWISQLNRQSNLQVKPPVFLPKIEQMELF